MSRERLILAAIVLAAILLRLPALLHQGLWRDEANVYAEVVAPTFSEFMHRVTEVEWHPPLYFVVAYVWIKTAGATEFSLQFLPYVCSIVTVPFVYRLGRIAGSTSTGLVAAAFYALSPSPITLSTAYVYSMMGLVSMILACLVASARKAPFTPFTFAAITFAAICAVYTHYLALVYIPVLALWALTSPRGIRRGLMISSALVLGLLSFVFWLPVFLTQRHIGIPYAPPVSMSETVAFLISAVEFVPVRPPGFAIFFFFFFAGATVVLARNRRLDTDAVGLGGVFLVMFLAVTAIGLRALYYVVAFYGLLCIFLAAVIVSLARDVVAKIQPDRRHFAAGAIAVLAVISSIGDIAYAFGPNTNPLSGIRTFVAAQPLDSRTFYLIAPDYLTPTFAFYARDARIGYGAFAQDDRPEIYRLGGQVAAWNRPTAINDSLRMLARKAQRYEFLDFVVDDESTDHAAIPYGKVWQLLHQIELRYPLVSKKSYAGRSEAVTVYRFVLRHSVSGEHRATVTEPIVDRRTFGGVGNNTRCKADRRIVPARVSLVAAAAAQMQSGHSG